MWPSLQVRIVPKIPIRRVVFLLAYLARVPLLGDPARFGEELDLVEAMQVIYTEALERALKGGIVRDYVERAERLPRPRGRIDAKRVVTQRFGLFPPLDCEFEDYSPDTETNRRLLAAAIRLARVPSRHPAYNARLRTLAGSFEGVSEVRYALGRIPRLHQSRRTAHYGAAIPLAELVLRGGSLELATGPRESVGFLVDMEELYERFVTVGVSEVLRFPNGRWQAHPAGLHLDEDETFDVVPDLVCWGPDGRPLLALDAKYKSTTDGTADDIYQLLAYCTALGLRRGALIYAHADRTIHRIRRAGIEIHVLELNPDGDPVELARRVDSVACDLASLIDHSIM